MRGWIAGAERGVPGPAAAGFPGSARRDACGIRFRLHGEAPRFLAALPDLPHRRVGGFEMAAIALSIEQRIRQAISIEPFPESAEQGWLGRKPQRQRLIV